ncbi:MAG: CdvA-like protein [Candidatus Bathyarchaeia archaeon]
MSQNSNLFLFLGKQVKDEYGRVIGKIASFALTPSGKFDMAFIQQNDGNFKKHSVEYLKPEGSEIILMSRTKTYAKSLCDQIPLIWRKDQALKDLSEKKKISPELYNELHSSFHGVLTQLKNEAQALSEEIDEEIARCMEELKALNYALVHLEIEHEIGKIDDKTYETAFNLIQENLKHVNAEKADLDATKNKLSNILLGDKIDSFEKTTKPKEASSASPAPELPEPPVVVYVKEIGKTGI